MAQSQSQLHEILKGLDGVEDAYFTPGLSVTMKYPCIVYERDDTWVFHADNLKYFLKKRYQVTVIDRKSDSLIPDLVEELPYTSWVRSFVSAGLNHSVYQLYF